jgi:hypothetical protein
MITQENVIQMGNMTINNGPTYIKKKKSKPLVKSSRTKKSHKSSYTILKRPLDERCGECAKIEINASEAQITSIFGWNH